ncbi:MAG: tRNA threonylcarbamoyladenosine biosynthesis protein TsaB [Latescibacteria bacterium DG_63]|uniref:tRNA N6-adenosine threonylcarbamoyltransferase n=2 Tax=Bacteria division TA06 TaxID=1156500 RepID=A0A0S8JKY2_UNCT6|nr:MAG: tRNA threonylcarbamoyladenosine biosynthesis protein TsaB [Latescibacteria bacterium DG_63]KPK70831.1 MAG: tRNA threonylcarbamoyladenosine biosynthesis protein TsaB [candidate division TA06 bacterium SM23_40]KPL10401.1 MAG: tRNA threonylcarbamoyladenosine biosynthesis protein TsaB [candidate division TA06 bacterium SM1_40]
MSCVLGIETSCDETAAAVVANGTEIISNIVASQSVHAEYGGVVPELASRAHVELVVPIITQAVAEASTTLDGLDGIAVTQGPGLIGCLLVGVSVAKSLAYALGLPFVGVNHIEAHIFANFLHSEGLPPPFLCLVASGGHTDLIHVSERCDYAKLGETLDDAAGEALDKAAKLLGLPYPGGPELERLATEGDPDAVSFPRPSVPGFDFSFSGMKTSVYYYLRDLSPEEVERRRADVAASFQEAVVDTLIGRLLEAADHVRVDRLVVAGGVASNLRLREKLGAAASGRGFQFSVPPPSLCTDNAAMVAAAGFERLRRGEAAALGLAAQASMPLLSGERG